LRDGRGVGAVVETGSQHGGHLVLLLLGALVPDEQNDNKRDDKCANDSSNYATDDGGLVSRSAAP